jgi:putative transposase
MPQVSNRHNRKSIRLQNYDYTQPGAYFVTVCTQNRACLFGEVVEHHIKLNSAGEMVNKVWHEIPTHYAGVDVDVFVLMPNHVHGIIILLENSHVGAVPCDRPKNGQP